MEAIMALILAVGVAALMIALAYPLYGWVLTKLWAWFMVPLGLPALTLMQAIGVILVVSFLTAKVSNREKTKQEKISDVVSMLTKPFVYLAFGYVAHLLMI